MNKGLAFRSAVTLLAFGCVIYIIFLAAPGRFSFDWQIVDAHTLVSRRATVGVIDGKAGSTDVIAVARMAGSYRGMISANRAL